MQKKLMQKAMRYAVLISMSFAIAGCERRGAQKVPDLPAIPAAIGDLVAVTPGEAPFQSVLWFKQSDQTIVAVRVNVAHGTVYARMVKFPRS